MSPWEFLRVNCIQFVQSGSVIIDHNFFRKFTTSFLIFCFRNRLMLLCARFHLMNSFQHVCLGFQRLGTFCSYWIARPVQLWWSCRSIELENRSRRMHPESRSAGCGPIRSLFEYKTKVLYS